MAKVKTRKSAPKKGKPDPVEEIGIVVCSSCGKECSEENVVYCSECGEPYCEECAEEWLSSGVCPDCEESWESEEDLDGEEF